MKNLPEVKLGLISVSRDCFPIALSTARRNKIAELYGEGVYNCPVTVENETDAKKAVADVREHGINALVVYLGNFGPETSETLIARFFEGPVMYTAAAEEGNLIDGRGDAYCGMLNCSYNLGMRQIKAFIPEHPVGTADEIAALMADFVPFARAVLGLQNLKVITFGPRPQDFFACNAPIKPLFDLGIEIQENSELDLYHAYLSHKDDPRIPAVIADMEKELGEGNKHPGVLPRLAQYELTLLDWAEENRGSREYVVFANKCWPSFERYFGFVPCYVNSRLTSRGMPVACEVDIYGAVSEYIGACVTGAPVTLLDINNTVPAYIYNEDIRGKYDVRLNETFMGFHCGNTPICRLAKGEMKYQLIQKRVLEPDGEPDISRGTLEGDLAAGEITFFRLQSNAAGQLKAYVAQGDILPVATRSFGGIGVFAIPEMDRFYRHVLIEKQFPHHGAVAFAHVGRVLFDLFKYLGITDISYNHPKYLPYPTENPYA